MIIIMKKKLLYVVNRVESSAVSDILITLIPHIRFQFDIEVVALQPTLKNDPVMNKFNSVGIIPVDLDCAKWNLLSAYFRLKKFFKTSNPAIIHSNLGRADIFSALAKPKSAKLLNTFHCERKNHHFMTRIGYRITKYQVDARVCISKAVELSYYNNWVLKGYRKVIYNPVDNHKIESFQIRTDIRKELSLSENSIILVNVGRLIDVKGHNQLLKVFKKAYDINKNLYLLLIGSGPLESQLKNETAKLKISNAVSFLGYRHDVYSILKQSNIFVSSSITEGLGVAIIEAMVIGIPIIAPPLPAIKEFISDGIHGLLRSPQMATEYSEAILSIANSPESFRKMIKQAKLQARKMFSPAHISKQYLMLYKYLTE